MFALLPARDPNLFGAVRGPYVTRQTDLSQTPKGEVGNVSVGIKTGRPSVRGVQADQIRSQLQPLARGCFLLRGN